MAFPHGLMFHQFCNDQHPRGQGAIDGDEFESLLRYVGLDRILSADDWLDKARNNKLEAHHCCLTFDDNLRCQFDIALPVLRHLGLTAFWFVYTSTFVGEPDYLEVYRYYRTVEFDGVDEFYDAFFESLKKSRFSDTFVERTRNFRADEYLKEFPFYSDSDRLFRFVRDKVLGPAAYIETMNRMISESGFDIEAAGKLLWMDANCLATLVEEGHLIGLHSHSHPTELASLRAEDQRAEYALNKKLLIELTGKMPRAAAHPCNSYSSSTLSMLKDLGVELAFRSNMAAGPAVGPLEFPREDHANIRNAMTRAT